MKQYDLVVIGGGPGGYVAAIRASQLGMKVALVEKAHLGGICLNWGCIPTKALLKSADVLRMIQKSAQFGIHTSEPTVDLSQVVARSRQISARLQSGVKGLLKKNHVDVINGTATLQGQDRVDVTMADNGVSTLSAAHIIIATGARARALPSMPVDGQHIWSYKEALQPSSLPQKMVVMGAGAIGVELACFYRAMGTEVSIVEMADAVLPLEDKAISAVVAKQLKADGIQLFTQCQVASHSIENGQIKVKISGSSEQVLVADVLLQAVGIQANTENLGLENTAVVLDRGHIVTDEFSRTAEKGVYAIGDVAGAPWLAHKASHEGVICVEKIMGLAVAPLAKQRIPACTYSHPQVASVGYSEAVAKQMGLDIKVGQFSFMGNGKALAMGEGEGFVKVIFAAQTGELLGAHMVGEEVTEMINGFAIAQTLESTEEELMHSILPHPTMSEAMHEAVLAAYGRALHQ